MVSAQKNKIYRSSDAEKYKVREEGKVILKRQSEFGMLAPDHSIYRGSITFLLSLLFSSCVFHPRRFMIFSDIILIL